MKRFSRVLLVLGIIAALLVGVEFGVRSLVHSQLRQAMAQTDLELGEPTVELGGGSVLGALVLGRFVDISGTAGSAEVPFDKHRVDISDARYHATEIRLLGLSEAVIGRLDLAGTLGWRGLSDVAGLPVGYGGPGRLLVTYQVDVIGLNLLEVGISGVPRLDVAEQQLELTESRIEVAGIALDAALSQQIIDRVVKPISLKADDRLQVTAVAVSESGLVVDLTATDVPVRR